MFDKLYGLGVFLISLNFILEMGCMVWGIIKLYDRYQSGYLTFNIATVCLSLESSGCFLRAISHLLYLMIVVVPYVHITGTMSTVFYYLGFPFTLASGIFLIFFWIDVTSRTLYHGAFLDRAFWPAFSLVAMCYTIVIISVALLLVGRGDTAAGGTTAVILFLLLVVSIIYFIAAYKVNQYMKNRKDSDPVKEKDFKRMTMKIVFSGAQMVVIILFIIMVQYRSSNDGWLNTIIMTRILYVLLSMRSYLLIDLFSSPTKSSSKSTQSQPSTNSTVEV